MAIKMKGNVILTAEAIKDGISGIGCLEEKEIGFVTKDWGNYVDVERLSEHTTYHKDYVKAVVGD